MRNPMAMKVGGFLEGDALYTMRERIYDIWASKYSFVINIQERVCNDVTDFILEPLYWVIENE